MTNISHIMPHNIEAEAAVLGSIILDNQTFLEIREILVATDFYKPSHQKIYIAMLELISRKQPIDVITLADLLKTKGDLDYIGGFAALASLVDNTPTAINVCHWAEIVRETAKKRALIEWTRAAQENVASTTSSREVANFLMGKIAYLTSDYRKVPSEVDFGREIKLADLQTQTEDSQSSGIEYLPVLNHEQIIVKGWSHMLAGYPKTGKTEFMMRIIPDWRSERILYITEEPQSVWVARKTVLPPGCDFDHMTILLGLGITPNEIIARIQAGNESVVVFDTVRNLLQLQDESNNSEVARALIPYITAARSGGKTLIALHHERKGGGEHGEGIAGAHAFLGLFDIALELKRQGPESSRRRLLRGWGRVIEIPQVIYELREDNRLVNLGSPSQVALEEVKENVRRMLDCVWTRTKDVRGKLGDPKPSEDQVLKALDALAADQKAERDPPISAGKLKGATYRWRSVPNVASDGASPKAEVNRKDGVHDKYA